MIWVPYFETIISNTCVVRYAYICADVAIIEDYCYARCLPVSRAAPHYRCSQPSYYPSSFPESLKPIRRSVAARRFFGGQSCNFDAMHLGQNAGLASWALRELGVLGTS